MGKINSSKSDTSGVDFNLSGAEIACLKHRNAILSLEVQTLKSQVRLSQEEMPARERLLIMNQAIDQVSKHFAVPHKSKDVLADRLNAVEETYKRLMSIVSETK